MQYLSKKKIKELEEKLPKGYIVNKKDNIKINENIIYKDDKKFLIIENNNYLPHLNSISEEHYKSVYIDKGAIPFVLKGADLMRPGITKFDNDILKDEIVIIRDENHNKILALGFTLNSSEELKEQTKGKSVKIFHYFKDKYY